MSCVCANRQPARLVGCFGQRLFCLLGQAEVFQVVTEAGTNQLQQVGCFWGQAAAVQGQVANGLAVNL